MMDYKVKVGLIAMRRNTTDRPKGTFLTWYSAEQRGKRFVDYIEKNFASENVEFVDNKGIGIEDLVFDDASAKKVIDHLVADVGGETIKNIIDLSNVARKEGLLALEEAVNELDDEYLKKGILLIVDGTDPELVRAIMETEMVCIDNRHKKVISFYDTLAAMGPAWGMIGTLIGLINMLKGLSDIATVGPNMAVALITTLYGSLLANWIAFPVGGKLRYNNEIEIMLKEVTIEGLLSIQAGENPRFIEEKLLLMLVNLINDVNNNFENMSQLAT